MAYSFTEASDVSFELCFDKKSEKEYVEIRIPTYLFNKPRRERAVRPVKIKGKDTGWHEVPKADSFVALTKKLAENGDNGKAEPITLMLQCYRRIPAEVRHELYRKATEQGLKVHPIDMKEDEVLIVNHSADDGVTRVKL